MSVWNFLTVWCRFNNPGVYDALQRANLQPNDNLLEICIGHGVLLSLLLPSAAVFPAKLEHRERERGRRDHWYADRIGCIAPPVGQVSAYRKRCAILVSRLQVTSLPPSFLPLPPPYQSLIPSNRTIVLILPPNLLNPSSIHRFFFLPHPLSGILPSPHPLSSLIFFPFLSAQPYASHPTRATFLPITLCTC
eukprot:673728-Rhodomonas_salina.2